MGIDWFLGFFKDFLWGSRILEVILLFIFKEFGGNGDVFIEEKYSVYVKKFFFFYIR